MDMDLDEHRSPLLRYDEYRSHTKATKDRPGTLLTGYTLLTCFDTR
jgi:hypothetical protein